MKTKGMIMVLVGLVLCPLDAVFVASSEPNQQNSAPADDRGWQYMGVYNTGGAVYMGNGWFLTAGHLGQGGKEVRYQEESYGIDPESWTPLLSSLKERADAQLFRIERAEALPVEGVQMIKDPLEINDRVTLIGPGRDVKEVVVAEDVTRYYQGEERRMKWGENVISNLEENHRAMGFRSNTFDTSLAYGEAQALDKDSGGGVFMLDAASQEYRLAGIMIAAALRSDEQSVYAFKAPSLKSTESSWTRSVELYRYTDQINKIIAPKRKRGWMWGLLLPVILWMCARGFGRKGRLPYCGVM